MFRIRLIITLFFISAFSGYSQQINFYSDCFYGGVTGGGFNPGLSPANSTITLNIPTNATIRKAFLFATSVKYINQTNFVDSIVLTINGDSVWIGKQHTFHNNYTKEYGFSSSHYTEYTTLIKDITQLSSIQNQSIFNITSTLQIGFPAIWRYYILILYDSNILSKTAVDVYINNQNYQPELNYSLFASNDIDYSEDVGIALNTGDICDTIDDGSFVYVNSHLLGLIGGNEFNTSNILCSSPSGNFYYENNILHGLTDDTSDSLMNGTDVVANIKNYGFTTPIDVSFIHQSPSHLKSKTNVVDQLFLTYTTPCDTFTTTVTQDTTICYGETLQLQATGGQSYEWAAVADSASGLAALSCTDCPNPVFSGNSSQVYTVRIWNNDSCSVVKPVRVNVSNPQYIRCYTGETKCGASNGYIQAIDLPSDLTSWHVVSFNGDTLDSFIGNTLPNLEAGDYSVHYIDNFGCKSNDTIVTVEPYNNTVADFSVNPPSGMKPLEVFLENQSQNATDFEWFLNGVSTGTTPITFFDSSGVYEISLTAWELDPSCADTTSFTVIVFDSLVVTLPNVFTPNGDGVNDFFNIETNLPVVYELSILNRWGNVLFENNGKLTKGTHNLWNGKNKSGEPVTDGTYFYMISFLLDEDDVNCEVTDCEVRKNGFVQVFGK